MNQSRQAWHHKPLAKARTIFVDRLWRNNAVRAVLGTSGANAAILGLNLLTGVITARLLAPVGRGALAAVTMWPQFLGFALAFGIPTALVFHTQRGLHDRRHLVSAAAFGGIISGTIGGIIGVGLLPLLLASYPMEVIRTAQICMVFTPFGLLLNILSSAFLREGTMARYNYVRIAAPFMTLIILLTLAGLRLVTVELAALAYLVPNIPIVLWTAHSVHKQIGFDRQLDPASVRGLLSYGLRYYGAEVAGTLSSQLDRILVVWLLTPAAMGLYVVALSFSRIFQQFPLSISVVLLPKAAGVSPRTAISITIKSAIGAAVLSFLLSTPIVLFGGFFLRLFFGPGFDAGAHAFAILTAEAVIGGVAIILSQAFLAVGRPARMSFYQIIGLLTIAPLLLWLGPRYGIVGASLAMLGSTTLRVILMIVGIFTLQRTLPSE